MGNTTADKLKEMMEHYKNRVNHIDSVINTLSYKLDELQDKKNLIETDTINPLITNMDNTLSSLNKLGDLYKNNYYGVEDVQGWAWYKSLGYNAGDLIYIDDDTFYIMGYINDIKTGDYLLIKDSKYGYMERKAKRVDKEDGYTKIFLDKNVGALSNPISLQGPYLSHNDSFPSCVNGGGKMPARTDCCNFPDRNFDSCETVPTLVWKKIETEISGSGTQQLEVYGGLQPYTWWVENTGDFVLDRNETESTKNILTYNYKGTGSKISVTDYCGSYIEEEFMPQDLEYLPGVFKIIVDADVVNETVHDFPMFIKITSSTGRYNFDLSEIFDEIGDNWKKLYIQDSYPFNSGNNLYIEMDLWDASKKQGCVYFAGPVNKWERNIFYCYYGNDLNDNDKIKKTVPYVDTTREIWANNNYPIVHHFTNWDDGVSSDHISLYSSSINYQNVYVYTNNLDGKENFHRYGYFNDLKNSLIMHENLDEFEYNAYNANCDDPDDPVYTYPEPIKKAPYDIYEHMPTRNGFANTGDFPPGEYTVGYSSRWTWEIFFKPTEPIMQLNEDCWEEPKEYLDKQLYNRSSGPSYDGNQMRFDATDGALVFTHSDDWYKPRNELLRSNKKYWSGWLYIVFTYDWRDNILSLYVNGILDKSVEVTIESAVDPDWLYYPWIAGFGGTLFTHRYYSKYENERPLQCLVQSYRASQLKQSIERINMNYLDLTDNFVYYERIAKPSRS